MILDSLCTCHHPAAYHTGPYTSCGAINCRCTRYEADERDSRDGDGAFDDGTPPMECIVGFREMC